MSICNPGDDAIKVLEKCRRPINIITIGGNQLTGKSTLCNSLLIQLSEDHYNKAVEANKTPNNVAFLSAGQLFRQMAANRGIEVAQLSKEARANNDIDIVIEYETCKGVMGGIRYTGRNVNNLLRLDLDEHGRAKARQPANIAPESTHDDESEEIIGEDEFSDAEAAPIQSAQKPTNKFTKKPPSFIPPLHPEHTIIIEGRNPAVMAAYCAHEFDQTNIFSVYLYCNPREQALRYLKREVGLDVARVVTSLLPQDVAYDTLDQVSTDVKEILRKMENNEFSPSITETISEFIPQISSVINKFSVNQQRDDLDRQRYLELYDFPPTMDYTSPTLYDLIVDTSSLEAPQLLQAVYDNLPDQFTRLDDLYHNQKF